MNEIEKDGVLNPELENAIESIPNLDNNFTVAENIELIDEEFNDNSFGNSQDIELVEEKSVDEMDSEIIDIVEDNNKPQIVKEKKITEKEKTKNDDKNKMSLVIAILIILVLAVILIPQIVKIG